MFLRRFVASQSLIWGVSAVLLLAVPREFTGFFGAVLSDGAVVVVRLFGAELAALTIVSYAETAKHWPTVPRAAWLAYALSNTLGFAVTLTGTLSGAFNARGWILVATYFLYAAVFIAVLLKNPVERS